MKTLKNSNILVTGGSGGIGSEVCRLISSVGATVISVEHSSEMNRMSCVALALAADLRRPAEWDRVTAVVLERFGQLDGLIHCAGVLIPGTVLTLSVQQLEQMVSGNFLTLLYGIRSVAPVMIRQGSGHIVTIGSLGGILPMPYEAVYSATKFAVRGLCLSVSEELKRFGVHVSLISTGPVETKMLDTEAHDKKSYIAFMSRSQNPADIATAVFNVLINPRTEVLFPRLAGICASVVSHCPPLFRLLYRYLRPIGEKRQQAYVRKRQHQAPVSTLFQVKS